MIVILFGHCIVISKLHIFPILKTILKLFIIIWYIIRILIKNKNKINKKISYFKDLSPLTSVCALVWAY